MRFLSRHEDSMGKQVAHPTYLQSVSKAHTNIFMLELITPKLSSVSTVSPDDYPCGDGVLLTEYRKEIRIVRY